MGLKFNGMDVALRDYKSRNLTLSGFEQDGVLWLLLGEVASLLKVNTDDVKELLKEEPEDFATLSDGRAVIKEGGFNYLALFVSETAEAKEYQDWVFGRVVPSVIEKGYYSVEEEMKKHE